MVSSRVRLAAAGVFTVIATGVLTIGTAGAVTAGPAAPSVAPNPVAVGGSITVMGTGCASTTALTIGADAAILDGDGNLVVSGGAGPSQIVGGAWTVALAVPANLTPGDYEVASFCDQYQAGFDYPPVALTIIAATATPPTTSTTSTTTATGLTAKISNSTLAPGDSATVTGAGFVAGEQVKALLHSTPVQLVALTASSQGTVSGTITIPTGTVLGAHTIELLGATSGRSVSTALTVEAPTLAFTGSRTHSLTLLAFSLLFAGVAMSLGAWRWRTGTRPDARL